VGGRELGLGREAIAGAQGALVDLRLQPGRQTVGQALGHQTAGAFGRRGCA
jgi:hypothetical protein